MVKRRHRGFRRLAALSVVSGVLSSCGVAGTDTLELGAETRQPDPDASSVTREASAGGAAGADGASRGCALDLECSAPRARCDTESGLCVECLMPADCGADNRTCDLALHTCFDGCSSDLACPPEVPHCDLATGQCLVCTEHAHCITGDDVRCDLTLGRCVDCILDADCADPARPFCEPLFRECVGCVRDTDCPDGEHCPGAAGAWRCTP